jgi:hypothetical protein
LTRLKIAHIKQNDVNVIIVPLAPLFGTLSSDEKDQVISALQERAAASQLNGWVVPVWMHGGRMHFIAHPAWHLFFQRLKMSTVRANLNRELEFDDEQTVTQDNASEQDDIVVDMRALLAQLDPQEKWPHELPQPSALRRIARWFGFPSDDE